MRHITAVPARVLALFASEVAILFACFTVAAYTDLDLGDLGDFLQYDSGIQRIGVMVTFVIAGLFFRNLYSDIHIRSRLALFQDFCLIFGLAFIGQGLISYISNDWTLPRRITIPGCIYSLVVLFGWRMTFDRAAKTAPAGRVLFIGMSPTVASLAGYFDRHPESGLMSLGYLESGHAQSGPAPSNEVGKLGTMADLDTVVDRSIPDSIVIGNREDIQPWWTDDFLALRFGGIRVEEIATLYERVFARKCLQEIWPARVVFAQTGTLASGDIDFQWFYSCAVALVLGVVTLPVTLTVALLIRLTSPGPALVREPRIGIHDRVFQAYRFRCVGSGGEATALGRFLRRHRLVWMPQLLNVLKGDMAMVGPRPERPAFARRMSEMIPFYSQRHNIRPGVTGWARIHRQPGEEQDSVRDLEYDLYYLDRRSPLLDSLILLLSLKTAIGSGNESV